MNLYDSECTAVVEMLKSNIFGLHTELFVCAEDVVSNIMSCGQVGE